MKKTVKLLTALIVAVLLTSMVSVVFAGNDIDPTTINANFANVNSTGIKNIAGSILGWVRNIAAILSVVLIAILGVKFMLGSTEERAEYKKSFMPLIIGLFVVLAASTIAGWIWGALNVVGA